MNQDSAANEFLSAFVPALPNEERMILAGFGGCPSVATHHAWKPLSWKPGRDIKMDCGIADSWNAYCSVSSFRRVADGSFRRRTEAFAAGRALLIDDVYTKVPLEKVSALQPSAKIRTSPGNEQWWFFLDEPCYDVGRFDAMIRAFISQQLCDQDPGMAGVSRVARLPGYWNRKKAYGEPFKTQLVSLNDRRFSIDEILSAFKLKLNGVRGPRTGLIPEEAPERVRMFQTYFQWLSQHRMIKSDPDRSEWVQITCPFVDSHTGGLDNGSAIRLPHADNNFWGGFSCMHGHCIDKTWGDLVDYINDISVEELEEANR